MTQSTNTNAATNATADASSSITPDLTLIRNDYRWTPACQRAFLEELSCTGSVTQACTYVGKSPRSAYDLRFRRDGAALALGWDGAILMARIVVADQLMDRALIGYEEVSVKQDDGSRLRHKQDNRLGLNLLARLDRMADAQAVAGSRQAQVQLVLQDFEAYLDLIELGGTGAPIDGSQEYEIECELERISAAEAEAEDAARAQRAQVMLDMEPEMAAQLLEVWYDEYAKCWKTNFPAPGAAGDLKDMLDTWNDDDTEQSAFFGDEDYERTLTQQELSAHFAALANVRQPWIDAAIIARDAWFGGKVAA
jgi:hypothetical protein